MISHPHSLAILLVLSCSYGCADTTEPGSPSDDGGPPASGGGGTGEGGSTDEFGAGGDETGGGADSCNMGEMRLCYPGPEADAGVGACTEGTQTCVSDAEFSSWSECEGYVLASEDTCGDGIDNDCDGEVDPGCCVPMDYSLTTGFTASGGMVCCEDPGTLISVADCGDGDDHWVVTVGDCGVAYEGDDNNGGPCVAIQCHDACE